MKIYKTITLYFIASLFFNSFLNAQMNDSDEVYLEINDQIILKYGNETDLLNIYNIDSIKNTYLFYPVEYMVQDYYGELTNTVLFIAIEYSDEYNEKAIVGLFKNGSIIWDSGLSINYEFGDVLKLFAVYDINNDNKIDIMFTSQRFSGSTGMQRLYIYSWDGITGTLLNEIDEDGNSTIVSLAGISDFNFVDVNADQVYEIQGLWYIEGENEEKIINYDSNSLTYGFHNTSQSTVSTFYTQNNMIVDISFNINTTSSGLEYSYIVNNSSLSKQLLKSFLFDNLIDSIGSFRCRKEWTQIYFGDLLGFADLSIISIDKRMNFIKPGEYDTFTVSSGYLPIILNAYLQGYNNIPQDSLRTIDDMYNNVLLNSVKINILGPGLDPLLIAQDHIDTLKSILLNGFRIGWITEQNVFNKYYNYLDSAGIYLANDQLHEYRNILNHILLESTNDSAETISSGIWLLLNYNIKHLILNTPIDKRLNFNIKLINSRGKSLTCGRLQYYEGGWNNAVNNGNGTFLVNTIQPLVSLHITYEYGT